MKSHGHQIPKDTHVPKDILKQLSHLNRNLGALDKKYVEKDVHKKSKDISKKSKDISKKSKDISKKNKDVPKTHKAQVPTMKDGLNSAFNRIKKTPTKYPKEHKWIAPPGKKGIKYMSYLGSTGYADAAKGYIRSLVENGAYVYVEPIRYCDEKPGDKLTDNDSVLAVCLNNSHIKYDDVIIHSIPSEWKNIIKRERKINPSVRIYGLTVWETDRVDEAWMNVIKDSALTGLIVPSQWNAQTFIATSKALHISHFPKVYTCHHAITDTNGKGAATSLNRTTLYGANVKLAILCIGTWTCRKGIEESICAYLSAFPGKNDVVLYVKTSQGAYTPENTRQLTEKLDKIYARFKNAPHPRVILDTTLRPDDYIDSLVANCDVYISLCNSEGVGLGACQAALKGKIIVMTGYGGQTEYIKEGCWVNYALNVVKVPKGFVDWIKPPQKWGYPTIDHAVKILNDVYNDPKPYLDKSQNNRAHILSKFSYLSQGKILKSILGGLCPP
jgi:hypothetical protein